MKTESQLKKVLTAGEFAVTAECGPPKGADPEVIVKKGRILKGFVDSVNVTDNQTGVVRLIQPGGLCPAPSGRARSCVPNGGPGSKPDCPPIRHPGGLGPGDPEYPLFERRPSILRQSNSGPGGL